MIEEDFLNGQVLLIDKPLGWSSFQAVKKVKYAILNQTGLKKLKIGHAGTLDPLASGLLIMCTGRYTKQIESIQTLEKEYTGVITLGATTPSYDLETNVDECFPTNHLSEKMIRKATNDFIGDLQQIPPVFSALKKNGKRLYKYARNNEKIEIEPRLVHISLFDILNISIPKVHFRVKCSKGTYIRSLAYDFGRFLNSGGHLSELRRTCIGGYNVKDAISPDEYAKEIVSSN